MPTPAERARVYARGRTLLLWALAFASLCAPLAVFAQAFPGPPPTVAQIAFAPASIQSGGTSQLSIVFGNANDIAAKLTQTLTDSLPQGITVANTSAGGSCTGAAVQLSAGGGTVAYAAGAVIPAGGCTITVTVKGTSATASTTYTDTIPAGALQTNLGNNPAAASGTLTVKFTATVPKLIGLSQSAAAAVLKAAGLVLGSVQYGAGPTGTPYNSIYSQAPSAGSGVAPGSAVAIIISIGKATNPNNPLTSVPGYVEPSQMSEAAALERLCAELQAPGLALTALQQNLLANCKGILNTYGGGTDANGLKNTLNATSGKQATAQQQIGVQFAGTQFTNIGARLAQLRQGVSGASFAGLNAGVPMQSDLGQLLAALEDGPGSDERATEHSAGVGGGGAGDTAPADASGRLGFFINGNLRRGTQDTTDDETGFNFTSNGVTAGVDYRLTDNVVLGLAVGHANGNTQFTDGSGRLDSRSNTGSLYATYYNDAWYVDAIGTFGHISYSADRTTLFSISPTTVPMPTNCVAGQCTIDTEGSTTARQLAFGASAGYSFHRGGLEFGPDVALDYTHLAVNGYTETDGNLSGMALAFGEQAGDSLLLKGGGHASYAISTPIAIILPQVSARYIHEFKNDQRSLEVHYINDPSVNTTTGPVSTFAVYTDRPDRGYFDWTTGITGQFAFGIAAFINYSALAGESNIQTHEFSFGVRIQHLVH